MADWRSDDRELLARILTAEAGNQGPIGMTAAGNVIMNRANTTGYGDGVRGVIMKPGQFSPMNSVTGYARGEQGQNIDALRPSETAYMVADSLLQGTAGDITGGATHFFNPDISNPSWAQGKDFTRIGDHVFGQADAGRGTTQNTGATAMRQPTMTQGQPAPMPQEQQQPGGLRGLLSDPDFYDRLAIGLGGLTMNPNQQLMQMSADRIAGRAQTRQDTAAKNKTIEFLRSQPDGEKFVQLVDAIGAVGAVKAYQDQQSGSALPSGIRELTVQAQLAGLQPGTPEYQEFMLAGGGDPATFRALDRQARAAGFEPGTPEYQEFMATRGAGLAEGAVLGARTEQGGAAAGAVAAGGEMVTRAFEAFDQASLANGSIGTMNEAIRAIDAGARSGLVENFLPNVTEASAALNNAMNRMGLDVISSVTFGALSEGEMKLAMETAAPRNLEPQALREWLVAKRDAQEKARDALFAAARYLSKPGNTLDGWLDQQENNRPASGAANNAPAAAPTNFDPALLEFMTPEQKALFE
jgi:hypothetical protein